MTGAKLATGASGGVLASRGAVDPEVPDGAAAGAAATCAMARGALLVEVAGKSSAQRTLAPTAMSPPHIEHRARRLVPSTLAGSTRNTD